MSDQLVQRRCQQAGPVTPIFTLALFEKCNYGRGRVRLHQLLKWQDEGRRILLVFTGSALRLLAPDKVLGAGSAFTELTASQPEITPKERRAAAICPFRKRGHKGMCCDICLKTV